MYISGTADESLNAVWIETYGELGQASEQPISSWAWVTPGASVSCAASRDVLHSRPHNPSLLGRCLAGRHCTSVAKNALGSLSKQPATLETQT